jgi:hypothetical protein
MRTVASEELHNLCPSPNIIKAIGQGRMIDEKYIEIFRRKSQRERTILKFC